MSNPFNIRGLLAAVILLVAAIGIGFGCQSSRCAIPIASRGRMADGDFESPHRTAGSRDKSERHPDSDANRRRQRDDDEDEDEEAEFSGALEAMEFRRMQRLDGTGSIAHGALMQAKQQADDMFEPRDAGLWDWEWLGPGNVGGRVRAICFTSATTAFLGAACGGIWKTTNAGASWSPLTDFLASMSVTSIVVDPTNSSRLYAATGEAIGSSAGLTGAGIFRTTNGGTTWTQLPQTASWDATMRLATVPGTQTIYAANELGVFRSTDGGDVWTQVFIASNCTDVKVDQNNPQRVLVGTLGGVFLSTTGGGLGTYSWQHGANKIPASAGQPAEVAFGASGYMWAAVDNNNGELYRSTDSGTTWTLRNTGTQWISGGGYASALWASPDDANLVVVGGIDLWRSTDGGSTLIKISDWHQYDNNGPSAHADQHIILVAPGYGAANRRLYFGNDGGIQTCTNIYTVSQISGWTNLANNLGITQFYRGAASATGSYILGGTQDNTTLRYRPADGVNGWWMPFTGDGGCCAIDPTNTQIQYAEWQFMNLVKSTNGGQSFSDATSLLADAGDKTLCAFVAPFALDPLNHNRLVAGAGRIWMTVDAANTWFFIRGAIPGTPCGGSDAVVKSTVVTFAPNVQDRIWVGYCNGRVSHTTSSVSTWTDVDGDIPDRFVTSIAIHPTNANEVFVTIGGYATDTVWYTNNNGASWTQRHGSGSAALPAVQVNCITFHPQNPNWIYAGTDIGVFASEDKGLTWSKTPRYSGAGIEGPTGAEVDDLFWQGSEYLIAATHGRGMWRARPLVTVYVDRANNGIEDGSAAHPYNTVQEGITACGHGTNMSIQAGDYNETGTTTFNKRGRVVGTGNGLIRIH